MPAMLSMVWNLMSLMGAPYMWSLTMLGREARRSNRATRPLEVPTAHCNPPSSKRSAVNPSPAWNAKGNAVSGIPYL